MLYNGPPMLGPFRLLCLVLLVLPLAAFRPALAEEGDFDRLERVQTLQKEAIAASRSGDWRRARELAEIVLTLDDTVFTARSRLILVQSLEQEGQYEAALYELREYLDLPLSDTNRRRAQSLRRRLERLRDAGPVAPTRSVRVPGTQAGVPMLLGGIALSITGSYFIGMDLYWASKRVPSGTWAAIGTPMLLGGIALDIVGIVLIKKGRLGTSSARQRWWYDRRPRVALAWTDRSVALSLGGRW